MKRVGLILLAALTLGCSTPIEHGLDESAANDIVTSLQRAGVGASKGRDDDGAFVVSVNRADVVRALELLRSLGLPRGPRAGFGDIYKQPSLIPTPTEERARYVEALGGEIARTLETVDGVVNARVHLVLPEPDPLALDGKPRVDARAAVLLKVRVPSGTPSSGPSAADVAAGKSPIAEQDVRKLVAGGVPGLDPGAVSVVMIPAPEPPQAAGLVSLGPLRMTADSRPVLVAVILVACGLLALLAVLLLVTARRLAAAQERG